MKLETEAELKVKNEKQQEEFQKDLVAKFLTQVDLTLGDDVHISKSNKALMKKEEQIVVDNLLKQGSLPLQNAYKYTSRATLAHSNQDYKLPRVDLKKTFMQAKQKREVEISFDKQASRFPVYKDVSRLWHYDYKSAEQKRFKATQMWDPSRLDQRLVEQYLQALSFNWGPASGLTQEIALEYLMKHDFNVENALKETISQPTKLKLLIRSLAKNAEKIETIAFIGSLTE